MNYRFIFFIIGIVESILGLAMLVSSTWGYYYADGTGLPMAACGVGFIFVGLFLFLLFRDADKMVNIKTALFLVVVVWFVMCATGAVPYYILRVFGDFSAHAFLNSFFESTSGFTTTGASVLGNPIPIESLGAGVLFWRSLTHWIGGIGIIVMVLSILPMLGSAGMQIFQAEAPGAAQNKIHPRLVSTARALGVVYLVFTVLFVVFYLLGGMKLFDALCTTFGAIATGGFSNKDASISAFGNAYVDWLTMVVMFVGATSFSLHYSFVNGRPGKYLKSSEFKFYVFWLLSAFFAAAAVIWFSGAGKTGFSGTGDFVRGVAFQVTSIATATGYVTRDFDMWPWGAKIIFLILMLFGGCIGSTAGGIKIFRLIILFKYAFREIRRVIQPSLFIAVKYDGEVVHRNVLEGVCSFFILYVSIVMGASTIMAIVGLDMTSAISSVITTIGGVGPGFGFVGPMKNFFYVPVLGKVVLIFCMLFGRLEIIPFIALVTPSFWRK